MPFRYDQYRSPYAQSIAEMMLMGPSAQARGIEQAGAARANAEAARGNVWGGAVQNIGQTISAIPQQIQQEKSDAQRSELNDITIKGAREEQARKDVLRKAYAAGDRKAVIQSAIDQGHAELVPEIEKSYATFDKMAAEARESRAKDRQRQADYLGALGVEIKAGGYNPSFALAAARHARDTYDDEPDMAKQIDQITLRIIEQPESIKAITDGIIGASSYRDVLKPRAPVSVAPGSTLVDPETNTPVYTAPTKPEPTKTRQIETIENGKRVIKIVPDEAGAVYAAPPSEQKQPDKFWVFRDGKPIRISEAEYRPGDLPSNTPEQGRPVTSGDAEELAGFDTSRDDLAVLSQAISAAGATGTMAKLGAIAPNWLTEVTGWGTDAKKKQALIDRVKQVIGKTLEGGVLRKEDEAKYEKILPTIYDSNEVVVSKLQGVDDAMKKRKTRRLEALKDSGYDVSKFEAREQSEQQWERGPDGKLRPKGSK